MISANGVKAVLFDLDGTLRHNLPDSTQYFLDIAVALGAPDCPGKRRHVAQWTHYYWAQSPELSQDMQVYTSLTEEFWAHYARRSLEEFGCSPQQAMDLAPEMHTRMDREYQPKDMVFPEVRPTLEALQQAGYRLAVLSNRTNPFGDYMDELGLADYFEFALAAGEIGAWKPDPAVFIPALERLDAAPAQVLYVGDNYYADIVGARAAGIPPILIDPAGLFENPGCTVIDKLDELADLLAHQQHPDQHSSAGAHA